MSDKMPIDETQPRAPTPDADGNRPTAQRPLTPEAERALAEAEARRAERARNEAVPPKEIAGRGGLEPTRYGDWEINGLTPDF